MDIIIKSNNVTIPTIARVNNVILRGDLYYLSILSFFLTKKMKKNFVGFYEEEDGIVIV